MAIGRFIRYVERGLENKQTQYYQEKEITEFKEEELARIVGENKTCRGFIYRRKSQ
jgi:hypothetical protein